MKLAIIHYHLNPGGVTRIIKSMAEGLAGSNNKVDMVILCGGENNPSNVSGVPVFTNPLLNYLEEEETGNISDVANHTRQVIEQLAGDRILHIHNASLGKNPALTLALYQMASQGRDIVYHCHDFAEDRPANWRRLEQMSGEAGIPLTAILYPRLQNCHYAVLNRCDYQRLLQNKIPRDHVHLLPNPVSVPRDANMNRKELRAKIIHELGIGDENVKIVTYPVRGIRRKNMGEFILLAALAGPAFRFIITQAPRNPIEIPAYEQWKKFVSELQIPLIFEAGEKVDHEDLIRISDFCITTSTREGFGMVYLEPWLSGTPVVGRDLPCITADLEEAGVSFPRLYDRIEVVHSGARKDFGDILPEVQEMIILDILKSQGSKDIFMQMNVFVGGLFSDIDPGIISRNRQIILTNFSIVNYGKRLFALYKNFPG